MVVRREPKAGNVESGLVGPGRWTDPCIATREPGPGVRVRHAAAGRRQAM